ncbi:MAG TPA: glycosyltransferase family 2 protein [Leptospiraceae bacterium]|nr:glycosyltransferase family 2 protein [Leptospiraceae bacterium]
MLIGIIVSYHPEIDDLISNCKEIVNQIDKLILVDNGSNKSLQDQIINNLSTDNIIILLESKNLGLAAAQNIGIKKGLELGGDFFLFLDDDSSMSKESVEILRKEFEINPNLGIAACHIVHNDSKKEQKYWIQSKFFYKRVRLTANMRKLENVNTVISSGSLITRKVIEKCGFMREDFFIDYIDIEYCLRVRANGFTITVIRKAELLHNLGNTKSIQFSKLLFHPTNHSPERRFYMIRNRIWTWKLYSLQFPGWFLIDVGNFLVDNLRVFLLEKQRKENFKQFLLGLKEGFFKKVERR